MDSVRGVHQGGLAEWLLLTRQDVRQRETYCFHVGAIEIAEWYDSEGSEWPALDPTRQLHTFKTLYNFGGKGRKCNPINRKSASGGSDHLSAGFVGTSRKLFPLPSKIKIGMSLSISHKSNA